MYCKKINQRLAELLPDPSSPLFSAASYSLLSEGKRLRSSLVIATAITLGADLDISLDPACAIEMIHTYSLIHDDLPCMDNDNVRRGKPTLHKIVPEGMALLTGDYFLTFAFELIAHIPTLDPGQRLRLIQILSFFSGLSGMIGGQALDLTVSGHQISEETLLSMHEKKTGALFVASLQFGAVIARSNTPMFLFLENLGNKMGLAFQFLDDLLDAESQDAPLQKPSATHFYGKEGVKEQLERFKILINNLLRELPQGAPLIVDLLEKNLWSRLPVEKMNSCIL
ncbi:MAG TPA: polyprenyl synthetase family protein [Chlamydiales bacterium]|nr:polyprenyl synthetase family protein [Chlamydiales bacterium]